MNITKKNMKKDMGTIVNKTTSNIPIALKKNEKKFKKNDKILLTAFGGGLSWAITLIKKN
jgi:3-oxoacyl-[acyl-carrier-protein] synthase III